MRELIGGNGLRCAIVCFDFLLSFAISLVTDAILLLADAILRGSVVTDAISLLTDHYFQCFSIY